MIIKKFLDKDSRSVLAQVRKEFGADAILLSSRSVGDHFEMIAAAEYAEAELQHEFRRRGTDSYQIANTAPESEKMTTLETLQAELVSLKKMLQSEIGRQKQSAGGQQKMVNVQPDKKRYQIDSYIEHLDLSGAMRNSLKRRLQDSETIEDVPKKTLRLLSKALPEADLKGFPRTGIAFVLGRRGCGKTTALLKLAERHRMIDGVKGIGLIHYSHKRFSKSPFNAYARKTKARMIQVATPRRLEAAIQDLSAKKLILIDCDSEILATHTIQSILGAIPEEAERFLVLPADQEVDHLYEDIKKYKKYASAVVISKYDKPLHLNGLAELLIRYRLPLAFRSDAEKISMPILGANSHALIRKAFNLTELASVEDTPVDQRFA